MSILDALQVGKIKAELERVQKEHAALSVRFERGTEQYNQLRTEYKRTTAEMDLLKKTSAETGALQPFQLKAAISQLEDQRAQLAVRYDEEKHRFEKDRSTLAQAHEKLKQELDSQIRELRQTIKSRQEYMIVVDEEILLQEFGLYKPRYDLQNSTMYKTRMDQVIASQKKMVKEGIAATCGKSWTINNDEKEGQRMIKDYTKLILRAFNNECDASMVKVKFNNIEASEKRIRKAFETLNKLGDRMTITISIDYLNKKLEELYLLYEYELKKNEEKEEQKRIREQMREEAIVMKEIEEMKLKIEKEERHFSKVLVSIDQQIQRAKTDSERELLIKEKESVEEKLAEVMHTKEDVANREQNTRAGYVYVISNIGSFGDNVFKIGVTRRLDPSERIDELGDASVPFRFDTHAMIFSDDAPALENAIHKAFAHRRLNLINLRREFFKVTLEEIEHSIRNNFQKPVEFIRTAEAEQFRESQLVRATLDGTPIGEFKAWRPVALQS